VTLFHLFSCCFLPVLHHREGLRLHMAQKLLLFHAVRVDFRLVEWRVLAVIHCELREPMFADRFEFQNLELVAFDF
jgi:hypothetical protein